MVGREKGDELQRAIQSYFESLDREDWETMRGLWHPDGEMRAVGARPRVGREDVLDLLEKLFVPWVTHRDKPGRVLIDGTTTTVEVVFTGTTEDGREVRFEAVDVIDFEDGQIRRLSNWYDIDYARKVLG